MFAKLGRGSIVSVRDVFQPHMDAKDRVPIGMKGVVLDHHFGKDRPTVKFEKPINHAFVVDASKLNIIQGSSKFKPRNKEVIHINKNKQQILNDVKRSGFENISNDGWFSGNIYLDDGYGDNGHAIFRAKVTDGKIEVEMNKNDIPSKWRDQYDELFNDAVVKVRDLVSN